MMLEGQKTTILFDEYLLDNGDIARQALKKGT